MSNPALSAVSLDPPGKPLCVATLAVGAAAGELLALSGPLFERYARRVGADYRVLTGPETAYPLGYKFALARLLERYDRVVYFDADIVLVDDCPNLFQAISPDRLAMHDDWEYLPRREWLLGEYLSLVKSQGWTGLRPPETCLNTGVIVAAKAHRAAFDRPERPFPGTHTAEQSLVNLNIARHRVPVTAINWELNWQWWADRDRVRTAGVKVWHFASAPHAERLRLMRATIDGSLKPAATRPAPPTPAPAGGPGTELKNLLASLGVNPGSCACNSYAAQMNRWGVGGCKANRDQIVKWLKDGSGRFGWRDKLAAAAKAVKSGLAFKLHPLDPLPGLVDEAIRRAGGEAAG